MIIYLLKRNKNKERKKTTPVYLLAHLKNYFVICLMLIEKVEAAESRKKESDYIYHSF